MYLQREREREGHSHAMSCKCRRIYIRVAQTRQTAKHAGNDILNRSVSVKKLWKNIRKDIWNCSEREKHRKISRHEENSAEKRFFSPGEHDIPREYGISANVKFSVFLTVIEDTSLLAFSRHFHSPRVSRSLVRDFIPCEGGCGEKFPRETRERAERVSMRAACTNRCYSGTDVNNLCNQRRGLY